MIKFNIASINCCTEVEGPGKRLAIWFQGCNIHCKGCCNPEYQDLRPNHIITVEDLLKIIQDAKKRFNIEGVTYSGGEPTLQINLPYLTKGIKEMELSVISFTGRNYEDVKYILEGCDVVLDGAFEQNNLDDNRKILGSLNQRIICLTNTYKDIIDKWFTEDYKKIIEINIGKNFVLNGDKII